MDNHSTWTPSTKELRFVTSVEQLLPYLDNIIDEIESDYENGSIGNGIIEQCDEIDTEINGKSPPLKNQSDEIPNIYEEYVNFIDLSVLNPLIDAADCQIDTLIEEDIREHF